jgi:hypothetical protein
MQTNRTQRAPKTQKNLPERLRERERERERERNNPTFHFLHLRKGNLHQKLIICQRVSAIQSFSVIKSEHVNAMTLPCRDSVQGLGPLSPLSLPLCVSACACMFWNLCAQDIEDNESLTGIKQHKGTCFGTFELKT